MAGSRSIKTKSAQFCLCIMFQKINQIQERPAEPSMIWDGACGFCKYWVTVWESKTQNVEYIPFQLAATHFEEIPLKEFKKASRFIDVDGRVYSGPDSAYMSMAHFKDPQGFWHKLYANVPVFTWLSDHGYNFVAKNRPFMMKLTIAFWGLTRWIEGRIG